MDSRTQTLGSGLLLCAGGLRYRPGFGRVQENGRGKAVKIAELKALSFKSTKQLRPRRMPACRAMQQIRGENRVFTCVYEPHRLVSSSAWSIVTEDHLPRLLSMSFLPP